MSIRNIFVYTDNDGDFMVTNRNPVVPGVAAFQLASKVREFGGPIEKLKSLPLIILMMNSKSLAGGPDFDASMEKYKPALSQVLVVDEATQDIWLALESSNEENV